MRNTGQEVEGTTSSEHPGQDEPVQVVSCANCEAPVMANIGACPSCGTPLGGKEFIYIPRQAAGRDIPGLFKWWGIWSVVIWALSGFTFGIGSSILFTFVSTIYLMRILRAYYK